MIHDEQRLREALEVLAGLRKHGLTQKAAVRIEDLTDLLQLPPKLKAEKITGNTVSVEQYNQMVDDNAALHKVLNAVVKRIQGRIIP